MRASTILALCLFAFGSIGHVSAATELRVGDPAPDFALKASNGKTYKVSDFRNKQAIVLAWFPKAYTRGCTLECKSLAEHGDLIKQYEENSGDVLVEPLEHRLVVLVLNRSADRERPQHALSRRLEPGCA